MSSSDIAVSVRGLSKSYTIALDQEKHITLAETMLSRLKNPLRRSKKETFWALKDINFDIKKGDVVGIIGRNGAGKSTLLKVLSRITEPTTGQIDLYGRVGSLLEVGTGFHPELTGRENIFLNGAILGMNKAEIRKQFDAIVDFAGVEKFLDTPVKRYSSGMYVRLAFAVAAHLNPEILIIDEVLAVGDAQFQQKCMGKMSEVAKQGQTVIFVSHNMAAISNLTRHTVYLNKGRITCFDETSVSIQRYFDDSLHSCYDGPVAINYFRRERDIDSPVRITEVSVNRTLNALAELDMFSDVCLTIELDAHRSVHGANLTVIIKDSQHRNVSTLFSWDQGFRLNLGEGRNNILITILKAPFSPGRYYADIGINQSVATVAYDVLIDIPIFDVRNNGNVIDWTERPWGAVHIQQVSWEHSK